VTATNPDAPATPVAGIIRPASGLLARIPADDTLPRWRAWVTAHPIAGSLLAGVVATQLATVFGIAFTQWIREGEQRSLADIAADVLGELLTLTGKATPSPRIP